MLRELAMRCRDPTASCFDLRSERLDFCFPGFFSAPLSGFNTHPVRTRDSIEGCLLFSTRLPPFLVHCTRTADCLYIPFFFLFLPSNFFGWRPSSCFHWTSITTVPTRLVPPQNALLLLPQCTSNLLCTREVSCFKLIFWKMAKWDIELQPTGLHLYDYDRNAQMPTCTLPN